MDLVVGANGVALGMFAGGGATAGIPWRVLESHLGAASPGTGSSGAGLGVFCGTNGKTVFAGARTGGAGGGPIVVPSGGDFDESAGPSPPRGNGKVPGRDGLAAGLGMETDSRRGSES